MGLATLVRDIKIESVFIISKRRTITPQWGEHSDVFLLDFNDKRVSTTEVFIGLIPFSGRAGLVAIIPHIRSEYVMREMFSGGLTQFYPTSHYSALIIHRIKYSAPQLSLSPREIISQKHIYFSPFRLTFVCYNFRTAGIFSRRCILWSFYAGFEAAQELKTLKIIKFFIFKLGRV